MGSKNDKWDSNVIVKFFETFEHYPVLWDKNEKPIKDVRHAALERFRKHLERIDVPVPNVEYLKTKIKVLRNVYRCEVAKVRKSQEFSRQVGDIYKPKLVWFDKAKFLYQNTTSLQAIRERKLPLYLSDCPEPYTGFDDSNEDVDTLLPLIKCVQKYECLYDYTLREYSLENEQNKAWEYVAQELDETTDDCKQRWQTLCDCLLRYLKNTSSEEPIIEFHLYESMKFVIPFLEIKKESEYQKDILTKPVQVKIEDGMHLSPKVVLFAESKSKHQSKDSCSTRLEAEEINIEVKSELNILYDESNETDPINIEHEMYDSNSLSKNLVGSDNDASPNHRNFADEDDYLPRRKRKISTQNETDLHFFKSILPDVAHFNLSQKRLFKQRVLHAIDEITHNY